MFVRTWTVFALLRCHLILLSVIVIEIRDTRDIITTTASCHMPPSSVVSALNTLSHQQIHRLAAADSIAITEQIQSIDGDRNLPRPLVRRRVLYDDDDAIETIATQKPCKSSIQTCIRRRQQDDAADEQLINCNPSTSSSSIDSVFPQLPPFHAISQLQVDHSKIHSTCTVTKRMTPAANPQEQLKPGQEPVTAAVVTPRNVTCKVPFMYAPKTKADIRASNNKLMTSIRLEETPQQHRMRLEQEKSRAARSRDAEIADETALRLQRDRERSARSRDAEIADETALRLQRDRERSARSRDAETTEETALRLERDRTRQARHRELEAIEIREANALAQSEYTNLSIVSSTLLKQYDVNPLSAQLMFANQSGFDSRGTRVGVQSHRKYAGPVSDEAQLECVKSFASAFNQKVHLSSCATCGIMQKPLQPPFKVQSNWVIMAPLLLTPEEVANYYFLGDLRVYSTVYKRDDCHYFLHARLLVDLPTGTVDKGVPLCKTCAFHLESKQKAPPRSVKHRDFGQMPEGDKVVEELTSVERIVVSRIVKFQMNFNFKKHGIEGVKGHAICFPHDGVETISEVLPRTDISSIVFASFIGTRDAWDAVQGTSAWRRSFFARHRALQVNPDRVYRYLLLKKKIDPNYANIHIVDSWEIRERLLNLSNQILDSALIVDDPKTVQTDLIRTDQVGPHDSQSAEDVTIVDSQLGADIESTNKNDTVMGDVLVSPILDMTTASSRQVLQCMQTATVQAENSRLPPANPCIAIRTQASPEAMFGGNTKLLLGTFPHLFLLGKGIRPNSGPLTAEEMEHLLLQHDGRFAKDSSFLFLLFNQLQRTAATSSVHVRLQATKDSLMKFQALVTAPGFADQLETATKNPDTPASRRMAKQISNVVSMTGNVVPWSPLERKQAQCRMMALIHYAGPFSFFITVAPSDMDSLLLLRISGDYSSNVNDMEFKLPTRINRLKTLARNPVAAALIYMSMVEALFEHLVKLPCEYTRRLSPSSLLERSEGLFGLPVAFAGVTEMQGRQSAHLHFVLTTDLSPTIIRESYDDPTRLEEIKMRLDSIVKAWIPEDADPEYYAEQSDLLTCEEATSITRDRRWTLGFDDANAVKRHGYRVATSTNVHQHSHTCHKGPVGKYRCRFSLPCSTWNRGTTMLQLIGTGDSEGKFVPHALREMNPSEQQVDPLLIWHDKRVVVLELQRIDVKTTEEDHNGHELYWVDVGEGSGSLVVTFSPMLSAVLVCNTNVEPLGTMGQSKNTSYYLLKYLTKDAGNMNHVLTLIRGAKKTIEQYPSVAEDSGTDKRTSQHLLTRLLNCLTGSQEHGGQTASLATLGFPSNVYSHSFTYCFIRPAVKACVVAHNEAAPSQDLYNSLNLPPAAGQDLLLDSESDEGVAASHPEPANNEIYIDHSDEFDDPDREMSEDMQCIIKDKYGRIISIPEYIHYRFRGPAFSDFSYYEYIACVSVTPVGGQEETSTADDDDVVTPKKRGGNFRAPLDSNHPQHKCFEQVLRSKQRVPILAGYAPPKHPGPRTDDRAWSKKARIFAEYVITLHHPWDLVTGAPPIPLTMESLSAWVNHMTLCTNNYVFAARLFWMRILARGTTVDSSSLKLMSTYRSRICKTWTSIDRDAAEYAARQENEHDVHNDGDGDPGYDDIPDVELFEGASQRSDIAIHADRIVAFLDSCTSEIGLSEREGAVPMTNTMPMNWRTETIDGQMKDMFSLIKSTDLAPFNNVGLIATHSPLNSNGIPTTSQAVPVTSTNVTSSPFSDSQLNEMQNRAFSIICQYAQQQQYYTANPVGTVSPKPLKLLISGAAGTGKSFLIKKLVEKLGAANVLCTAFTGIAASGLPQGKTIHNAFSIKLTEQQIPTMTATTRARNNFGDTIIVVIDEVSMLSSQLLVQVNKRLQKWRNSNDDFGGVGIILMGDFFQLPAIGGSILTDAVRATSDIGKIFNSFTRIEFCEQMRAADDREHSRRLEYFRNTQISLKPIASSCILDFMTTLKPSDFQADYFKWSMATIVVPDNMRRLAINKSQAIKFAIRTNQPVLCWIHRFNGPTSLLLQEQASAKGITSTDGILQHYEHELVFYFVTGAPASITENINTSKCLANGTQCIMHSITLEHSEPDFQDNIYRMAHAQPGEIILLQRPPISVNVSIQSPITAWNRTESLEPEQVVIPILASATLNPFLAMSKKTLSRKNGAFRENCKLMYYTFPVDLAFAVTYHKMQGRTVPAVILDLSSVGAGATMSVPALYVGVSRVKMGSDIRILPLDEENRSKLKKMQFNDTLVRWNNRK